MRTSSYSLIFCGALLAAGELLPSCTHVETPWQYSESSEFTVDGGDSEKEHKICREHETWYGHRRECFVHSCDKAGACDDSGDSEIAEDYKQFLANRDSEAAKLLATHSQACSKPQWSECIELINSLFTMQAFEQAQSLKRSACKQAAARCQILPEEKFNKQKLKRGESVLWHMDVRKTWPANEFFKTGNFTEQVFIDEIIVRR